MKRAKSLLSLLLVLLMCLQLVPAAMAEEPEAEPEEPAVIMPEEEQAPAEEPQAPAEPEEAPAEAPEVPAEPETPAEEIPAEEAPAPAEEPEPAAPAEARAEVIFRAESEEILAALTVFDAKGNAVPPVVEDGEPIPGMYELVPGKYTYSVAAEGYLPLEAEPLAVKAGESLTVTLALEPAPEEEPEEPAEEPEEPAEEPTAPAEPAAEEPAELVPAKPAEAPAPAEEIPAEEAPAEPIEAAEKAPEEAPAVPAPAEEPEPEPPAQPEKASVKAPAPEAEPAEEAPEKAPEAEEPAEPAPAQAPEEEVPEEEEDELLGSNTVKAEGWCGSNAHFKVTSDRVLTIWGTGDVDACEYGSRPWEEYADTYITKIVIKKGITNLGSNVFADMTGVKSVSLPYGLYEIDDYCFSGTGITSIALPSTLEYILEYAFYSCPKLRSVTIPAKVYQIGKKCFSYCTALETVNIKSKNIYSLEKETFYNCPKLKKVTLPSQLMSIGESAFFLCKSLKSITLPRELQYIYKDAFRYSGLTSLTLPNSVMLVGEGAFRNSAALKTVTLPPRTTIGYQAFYECDSIEKLVCGGDINNGDYSFGNGNEALTGAPTVVCYGLNNAYTVTATVLSSSKFKVTWDKCAYATGYDVLRYDRKTYNLERTKSVTKNYFTDTGMNGGTCYYYVILPYKKVGSYIYKTDTYSNTSSDVITPLAKPSVSVKNAGYGRMKISWKGVRGAQQYYVRYQYEEEGAVCADYSPVLSDDARSWTFEVIPGRKYTDIAVYARNNDTYEESTSAFKTLKATCPANLKPTLKAYTGRVRISWKACANRQYYNVYRKAAGETDYTKISGPITDVTYYDDTAVTKGVTYYYKVEAVYTATGNQYTYTGGYAYSAKIRAK